ncbi:nucleoside transporter, putative, partial [Entamoeba invadens IP1]
PPTKEQIDVTGNESPLKGFIRVFTTIWVQFVAITIDYFWTFAVFAGIFLGIHYDEGSMKQSTSAQITTFMYMTGDMLARLLYFIPIPFNKWVIFGFSCVRCVLYVPIFIYYYNVYTNPYLMFFIMLVFSVSHGYFGSWAMQLAYKSVKFTDMNITGGLLALAPDIGLAFGATVLFILQLVLPSNVQASD